MDRKLVKRFLPLMQALADGKPLQIRDRDTDGSFVGWLDADWIDMSFLLDDYRIKPEPKLRPWKPAEAPKFFLAVHKDQAPGSEWLNMYACHLINQAEKYPGSPWTVEVSAPNFRSATSYSLDVMARSFVRLHDDGTKSPCGVMEVEP